jgi:predicted nuclease of predicted toxin-antitoxin system
MALRFLADHCVSNSTVQSLQEAHHEVLRLKDVLPVESSDTIVIAKAQEIDAILLSLNGDFSHIVNYPPKNYKGIVAMQMHNHPEIIPKLIARLTAYLKVHTTMDHLPREVARRRSRSYPYSGIRAESHLPFLGP